MSLVLLTATALLGGLFYLQWHEDPAMRDPLSANPLESTVSKPETSTVPRFVPIPIDSLGEITERPLFTEGRVPPENPANNPQDKVISTPLRLKLEGVAITPRSKVAIITDRQTNELLRLSQGMSHGDWKVAEISEEAVTIQQGSREITLSLEIDAPREATGSKPRAPFKLPVPRRPGTHY